MPTGLWLKNCYLLKMLNKLFKKIKENKKGLLILTILLIISAIAHGYNMFHFPYYEDDEGTYMAQAWSLITQGKLAPYTYSYDHAPLGWILIALWTMLTGGFFTFGVSVDSGRVLMLVLHLAIATMLFYVAKRLSGGYLAGIIAVLIFSLSPLGIFFQRRVLLDNIMIFWVFLSLALLLKVRLKLSHIFLSSIAFGIAVLTKESAIFFTPAFLYLVISKSHSHYKNFAVVKWLAFFVSIGAFYFLYAILKGELFPTGTLLGGNQPHVSLIGTIQYQTSRGGGFFLNPLSSFMLNFKEWIKGGFFIIVPDPMIIILGLFSTLIVLLISIKKAAYRFLSFFTLLYCIYLIRGGEVIGFYIIPLLPFLALNIGVVIYIFLKAIEKIPLKSLIQPILLVILLLPFAWYYSAHLGIYTRDQTSNQIKAMQWVKNNISKDSIVLIDNYAFIDLHSAIPKSIYTSRGAQYYWKADTDPEIKDNILKNDWRNIDYILSTPQLQYDAFNSGLSLVKDAYTNSTILKSYPNDGWDLTIRRINKGAPNELQASWKTYKSNFISDQGQTILPDSTRVTTSEAQSYAMLRSVWLNDKETFNNAWTWTKNHFQHRENDDKLLSWLLINNNGEYKIGDPATASDADEDTALALLFAYKRWGQKIYLTDAKAMISDIWKLEVVKIYEHYYLTSGSGSSRKDGYLINPSYLSPATYRIFAEVDKEDDWNQLSNDSYYLLNKIGQQPNNKTYLPSNWILLDKYTGNIETASAYVIDKDTNNYGFDAFRTMWRVSLDYSWFNNPDALQYLQKVSPFFVKQWQSNEFSAVYDLQGNKQITYGTISTDVAPLSVFLQTNKNMANSVYNKLFENVFNYNGGYWENKNNYYDQNWAWFGTALYSNNLQNLWK